MINAAHPNQNRPVPSPKSGTPCTLVTPVAPPQAQEADKANPGEMTQIKTEQRKTQSGKYGSVPIKAHKTSANDKDDETKKSWIEIELVDKKNKPVAGEPYRVTLADGTTVAEGTLDEKGLARVDGIDPGMCKVTFPNLEKQAWKPA